VEGRGGFGETGRGGEGGREKGGVDGTDGIFVVACGVLDKECLMGKQDADSHVLVEELDLWEGYLSVLKDHEKSERKISKSRL
jgi:hypothetical protein